MVERKRKEVGIAMIKYYILMVIAIFTVAISPSFAGPDYSRKRAKMVQEIQADVIWTSKYTGKKEFDKNVLAVMGTIPRQEFVSQLLQSRAYENRPLPIGHGQTISQPYIVALMTDLLNVGKNSKVLEIGTGSGYQAAILGKLVQEVYTIEIIPPLGKNAKARLQKLGYKNIHTKIGDGYYGWKEHAPYDAIIVTAASNHIPPSLLKQLKPGGRMIIPLGSPFATQQLVLVEKDDQGGFKSKQILPVRFVPFKRSS